MQIKNFICLFFIIILVLALVFLFVELNKKESQLAALKIKEEELSNKINDLKEEINKRDEFFKNFTKSKKGELKNISFDELITFLHIDKTNEIIYNKEKFDCTGFALTLWENARLIGINVGFVDIEFENENFGHMLNAFKTDKGIVYIDVTGNENGTGLDKIAYIEKGKEYGLLAIEKLKENIPNCKISCEELIDGIHYIKFENIFSYDYFDSYFKCVELYDKCVEFYNREADKFNQGKSNYSYEQLKKLFISLTEIEKEITIDKDKIKIFALSKGNITKKVQIYW